MNVNGSGRGLHGDVCANGRHGRVLRIFQDGSFENHVTIRVVRGCARFNGLLRLLTHLLGAGNNREKKRASKKDTARSRESDWFHIPSPPARVPLGTLQVGRRSEEHTSELQSQSNLVCRLLLEKKTNNTCMGNNGCTRPKPYALAIRN